MQYLSLKRILVPTILTSGVVFYAATSLFTSLTLNSPDGRTLQNGRLQYSPTKEYKEFAVRSVGLCILVSVGSGFVVAEGLRRGKKKSKPNQPEQNFFSNHRFFAPKSSLKLGTPLVAQLPSDPAALGAGPKTVATATSVDVTENDLAICQPQQVCRIKVPYVQQSLFAISLNGQYYSFTQAERDPKMALKVLNHHTLLESPAVVTHTCDRYVVWTLQPYAELMS